MDYGLNFDKAIAELQKLEDKPREADISWPAEMNDGYESGQIEAYANARTLVSNLKHDVTKAQRTLLQRIEAALGNGDYLPHDEEVLAKRICEVRRILQENSSV